MTRRGRWGLILALVGLSVAGYVLYLVWEAGEFRRVVSLHPGTCRPLAGMPGSEDITVHPAGTHAFVSSDNRRALIEGNPVPGAIFRLDLDDPGAAPVNLTPDAGVDFRPHGLSLHVGSDGRETLFVVNHPGESLFADLPVGTGPPHSIEVFDVLGRTLRHRQTLVDPLLVSPNDIAAIDHRRFYVTNDHGAAPGLLRRLEDYLRLPWASVLHFDGQHFRQVAQSLSFANGINLSPDGSEVYVAEVTRSRIRIYQRDPASGELVYRRLLAMPFGPDNIEVDPDSGDLWVAGHVKLLSFVRHAADARVAAPSQAARVRVSGDHVEVQTRFIDDGSALSGASVAARHPAGLLIGSVFEPHLLDCRW